MGRKGKHKNKMFQTATEWREEGCRGGGGFKEKKDAKIQPLPFYCCSLTLQRFRNPVACRNGYVFDLVEIIQWLIKKKCHPVTGKKMKKADLIKLKFDTYDKDGEMKYRCPVTYKTFNEHSHITFNASSGHVYSHDAIKEMNLKPKNWFDLITGEAFEKKDLVTIQDPHNLGNRDLKKFMEVKKRLLNLEGRITKDLNTDKLMSKIQKNNEKLDKKKRKAEFDGKRFLSAKRQKTDSEKKEVSKTMGRMKSNLSKGRMAMGFTSTVMEPVAVQELQYISDKEVREMICRKIRGTNKKGYVRLHTNMGLLNLQLDCNLAPRTCMSFLELCERDFYKDTIFHRKITSFMIQGGDPTGTGRGGECAWGGKFKDEFHNMLKHDQRGVLSMANAGPDTNGSQFFLTFAPVPHLDNVHTVFGRLVGGNEVLNKLEMVPTDEGDKPSIEIRISDITIYSNPYKDIDLGADEDKKKKEEEEKERLEADKGKWWSQPGTAAAAHGNQKVGKYLAQKLRERKQGEKAWRGKDSIFSALSAPKQNVGKLKKKPNAWSFAGSAWQS